MRATNQPNNLKGQTSPYLLQHLHNPVDWYPWGPEALEKAVREDKPLLVSIGYSACHWCHVMERESFEDREVADLMNSGFVCIKVDREERPDIDHMYMTALQLLTRQGGWPLNCFSLPDTRPFWGGTYFTKHQWISILKQISALYINRKKDLEEQADNLTRGIAASNFVDLAPTKHPFNKSDAAAVFSGVMGHMDKQDGGTMHPPKFPVPVNLEFLLDYHYHSNEAEALDQVNLTLEKMAMGGIYDQIGGGFARYSTDDKWKVPHFEKMLYDNGQLVSLYSNAWKVNRSELFREVVYQTAGFVERELTSPDGTFYAALDADSEGEEGKYYVWNDNEIDEITGLDSAIVKEYYNVGKKGYWEEGRNILLRDEADTDFAARHGITLEKLREIITAANNRLLEKRSQRVAPGLDNKVIVSWNAIMITGLADAYAAFGDSTFIAMAGRAADYIIQNAVSPKGKINRILHVKKPLIEGFLDDYAFLIQALIRLFEVSAEKRYILTAKKLAGYVLDNFHADGTSLFPFSPNSGEMLKAPFYEMPDNVIPASNSVMAVNLLVLAEYFENRDWDSRSMQMLTDVWPQVKRNGISFANWARLLLRRVYSFYTVVITGPGSDRLTKEISSMFLPSITIASTSVDTGEIPLFSNRVRQGGTWIYVCSNGRCRLPVRELSRAVEQIRQTD